MPLDFTNQLDIPEDINFNVSVEPTEVAHKKLVRNADTGVAIDYVGTGRPVTPYGEFFNGVWSTMTDILEPTELEGAKFNWRTGRKGGFACMDVTLPHRIERITTPTMETVINPRWIAFTSIDSLTSANCFLGTIDQFCFNGQINGEHDKVQSRHSSNYTNAGFVYKLQQAERDFFQQTSRLQDMADTNTKYVDVKALLEKIMSETKAKKMYTLYSQETSVRGHNAFALYSAFTNYSTYGDERNGFTVKDTKGDTKNVTMLNRELEVNKWIATPQFKELVAA